MEGKYALSLQLDLETVEGLKAMAVRRGLLAKRGPRAIHGNGSISQLLRHLVQEEQQEQRNAQESEHNGGLHGTGC